MRVVVRVRPFLGGEAGAATAGTAGAKAHTGVSVVKEKSEIELRSNPMSREALRFKFDACYDQESTQEQLFGEVEDVVDSVLKGINTTLFAYGMTGAGKTHTMQGNVQAPGIIPRVVQKLARKAAETRETGQSITIATSYLEIYNERVIDLLTPPPTDDSYVFPLLPSVTASTGWPIVAPLHGSNDPQTQRGSRHSPKWGRRDFCSRPGEQGDQGLRRVREGLPDRLQEPHHCVDFSEQHLLSFTRYPFAHRDREEGGERCQSKAPPHRSGGK